MTRMRTELEQAVAAGRAGDRPWLVATYQCNLACAYCLTESHPRIADRRELSPETLLTAVEQAAELGFRSVGITGGEVFMLRWFPEAMVESARILPTIALTNGTLLGERTLDRLMPLVDLPAALQLSLDSAEPAGNDPLRGAGNHAAVIDAIRRLRRRGLRVRIATTVDQQRVPALDRLCELHRALGISDDDHIVRTIVRRGKAALEGLGVVLGPHDMLPELTLTSEGAFLHPFGPTVRGGVTDLDLRVCAAALPLEESLRAFLDRVAGDPAGADVTRNVR
jgi:MoaA/NifB/PqqE/SkfB family radical SAM enzyme